jgi:chaperonin cofactor prefoldin
MKTEDLIKAVADYVSVTGSVFSKAAELVDASLQEKQSAVELLPEVIEHLKTAGLISDSEVGAATRQLSSHADTLEILSRTVDALQRKHAAEIKELQSKVASSSQGYSYDPQKGTKTASSESNGTMLASDRAILAISPSLAAKYGCG